MPLKILALLLPISMYLLQLGVAVGLDQTDIALPYVLFIISFSVFGAIGLNSAPIRIDIDPQHRYLDLFFRAFVAVEIICFVYFGLVFGGYVTENGYFGIRNFMMSELIKSSPYYSASLMYVSAYILWALEAIVIVFAFLTRRTAVAVTVLACVTVQHAVFIASRIIFYEFLIIGLFAMLHRRVAWSRLVKTALGVGAAILVLSVGLSLLRDESLQSSDAGVLSQVLTQGILNYHLVSPLILKSITQTSTYFLTHVGYGRATFGFLLDPLLGLLPMDDAKSLMASHVLSGEAQNFIVTFGDHDYNAFTTLLFPAMFDFGILGPVVYGAFLGYGCGRSFISRSIAGALIYIIFARFVYLGAFTFSITGEWFWVLLLIGIFSRPAIATIGSAAMPEPLAPVSIKGRNAMTERSDRQPRATAWGRDICEATAALRAQPFHPAVVAQFVRRALPLWVACGLLCGALGVLYYVTAPKVYRATTLVMLSESARGSGAASASVESVASLAGIALPSSPSQEPMAFLRSRQLARSFIERHDLLPVLFARKWDAARRTWTVTDPAKIPDVRDGIRLLQRNVVQINDDKKAGTVEVQVSWKDPAVAARWAGEYVDLLNDQMRDAAIAESTAVIGYLNHELEEGGGQVGVQQAVSRALESQLQRVALARARKDYAFKVVDAAIPPKEPVSPQASLIALIAVMASLVMTLGVALAWEGRVRRARARADLTGL